MQEVSEVRPGLHHFHWPELGSDSIDYLTANGSFFGANEENETSYFHCLIFKASTQIPRQQKSHSLFCPFSILATKISVLPLNTRGTANAVLRSSFFFFFSFLLFIPLLNLTFLISYIGMTPPYGVIERTTMTVNHLVQSRQAIIVFPFSPLPDPRYDVSGTARRGMCLELEF